ncbi:MAG: NADH-ubiquinone oxidoreductase-F iron-sulfur binding region domain-containing protein [Emergencia sp.]
MERLYMRSKDHAQRAVEGLYKDLERRIVSSPAGQCPVDMAAAFLRLCHAQSCGKCVPCRVGLGQVQIMIEDILSMETNTDLKVLSKLEKTAKAIRASADCAIGVEAASWAAWVGGIQRRL